MQPESMVHALEQIHDLLKPEGHLIDIHPSGELVKFIRPLEGYEHFIGYLRETDDYIEYQQADEALEAAVSKGLYQVKGRKEFDFHTYANSFETLKSFLKENWSDAVIPDDVIAEAEELDKEYGKRTVFLREQPRVTVLKAVSKNR